MATIRVAGGDLAYDEAGTGPAVVLVHAGIADRRMWDAQFTGLARNHRVIRFDWPGRGDSADRVGEVVLYEDVLAVMDALDVASAALVGCSYGGAAVVDAALAAPDRVTALVPICAGVSGHEWPPDMFAPVQERIQSAIPGERLKRYREGTADHVDPADVEAAADAHIRFMVAGPEREVSELDPDVVELAMTMCRDVFARQWAAAPTSTQWLEPPAKGRLAEITAPALVINGRSDVPQIQDVSKLLAAGIPSAELVNLPEAGHLPPLERPAEVTHLIDDFLSLVG